MLRLGMAVLILCGSSVGRCGRLELALPTGRPACVTPQGSFIYGWTDCAATHDYESVALLPVMSAVFQPEATRGSMQHLYVVFRHDLDKNGAFQGSMNRVFGEANCNLHMIHVAWRPNLYNTDYAHELAHILDECRYDSQARDPTHPDWIGRGIWLAVTDAQTDRRIFQ